jgi:hypothetical protein
MTDAPGEKLVTVVPVTPILTRSASLGVTLFSPAPKGPRQISPGRRPGANRSTTRDPALKGRNNTVGSRPRRAFDGFYERSDMTRVLRLFRPLRASLSWNFFLHEALRTHPGRCPGLTCLGPFGVRFDPRNIKTGTSGWSTADP